MARVDADTEAKIKQHYEKGQGSIQDYARIYRLDMSEVLEILNLKELGHVEMLGDQVDEAELGPSGRGQVKPGEVVEVPFSTN